MKGGLHMNSHNDHQSVDEEIKSSLKGETEVPEIVRARIDETLESLSNVNGKELEVKPVRASRSSKSMTRLKYSALTAVSLLFIISLSSMYVPSIAHGLKQVPVIGSVFEQLGDTGLRQTAEKGYSSELNEVAKDKGITINFTEVYYDGIQLSVAYVIESDTPYRPGFMQLYEMPRVDFGINRKSINTGGGGSFQTIGDNHYAGVMTFTPDEQLPDDFNLIIAINEMYAWDDGERTSVEGNWEVTVPVTKNTVDMVIHEFEHPIVKQYGETTITLKRVVFSPRAVVVEVDVVEPIEQTEHVYWDFYLFDDQGMLQPFGSSGRGSRADQPGWWKTEYVLSFAPMDVQLEQLVLKTELIPMDSFDLSVDNHKSEQKEIDNESSVSETITIAMDKESMTLYDKVEIDGELPITLSQGKVGEISITEIQFLDDKTLVFFDVKGERWYHQATALTIVDAKGEHYESLMPPYRNGDKTESFSFTTVFPALNKHDSLFIATWDVHPPNLLEDLEIVIPFIQQ